jgi:hypothetical protein
MKRFVYIVLIILVISSLAMADTGVKKYTKVSSVQFQSDKNESSYPSLIEIVKQKLIKVFRLGLIKIV